MKIRNSIVTMALMFVTVFAFSQNKDDMRVMKDAEKAIKTFKTSDKGLETFFSNSSGYVIFPNVGEGALVIGAASGNGVLYENGVATGMASMKKLDIGMQAGGEAYSQVIFFETKDALNEFKAENFEFSAEAKAVIVDKGASKNANYNDGVVIFAKSKAGAMADVSVGGQKFSYTEF
ncbi:lipid-binding SYLF domain-containing protein [Winogradskyella undariae]|uniref:lipid-binding SYLF domain-containing protein n=1 Tax=Winogradskyella TaxID=286104 RepID=UPI00156BD47A|nr:MULTISPECIES: lipid-binding SYLF domain-containing protein [Winogradskyella]NRR92829.1 lipid-binding SYLF domain-containing protein [Winogradskyella undariae]QXP79865.1 lipid-binding SYLF domain-containing protein [Winogradskyella sp. HaHa_3_26]